MNSADRAWTLALVLVALACRHSQAEPTEGEKLILAGQKIGLAFPGGTRLQGLDQSDREGMIRFKVTIPRTAWTSFETTLPLRWSTLKPGRRGLPPDEGYWNPQQYPAIRTGMKWLPEAVALTIGVDDSAPDVVTMFVFQHGT